MLRERYTPINLFDLVPPLSMALDPVLTQLDHLLDDDTLFQMVKADLAAAVRGQQLYTRLTSKILLVTYVL
jgi:hypothetical protein